MARRTAPFVAETDGEPIIPTANIVMPAPDPVSDPVPNIEPTPPPWYAPPTPDIEPTLGPIVTPTFDDLVKAV